VVEVIVDGGGEEIVGGGDGVEVAGEMEVDVFHGDDLRAAAPRAAAFHTERGADRRLPERDDGPGADAPEGLPEPDGHGRLAVARRGGRDRRDDDELAVRLFTTGGERGQQHLGLVPPVGQPFSRREPQLARDVSDRSGRGRHPA